ncbi:MAG: hypothetical protein K2G58_02275, partial [Alistipes sp.]|nr:hypothetical protein [Alistipes sp.]
MRRFLLIFVLLTSLVSCHRQETMESLTERVFKTARAQLTAMDAQLDERATPRSFENGVFIPAGIRWWLKPDISPAMPIRAKFFSGRKTVTSNSLLKWA